MISTTDELEVKETTPPSLYRVDVPATNPLMPSGAVSLVKNGNEISLRWETTKSVETEGLVEKLASETLSRSAKQVDRYPLSSRAQANLGVAHLNAGAMLEAANAFEKALELDPKNYLAGINLAKVFVMQGRHDEAEKIYRRMAEAFPRNITPVMALANLAMRKDEFAEAEGLLRNAISKGPATPVPFYHLAVLLLRRGDAKEAIRHLRTALRHNVRSANLYQALGVAYALAGQNERSATSFRTALTLSPNLSSALKALAGTLLKANQSDTAIELLSSYIDREPQDSEARSILAQGYLSKQKYASARGQFMQMLALLPSDEAASARRSELANDIGFTYFSEHQFKEAEEWLKKAIEHSSTHGALPYHNLAHLYSVQERYKEALDVLQTCTEVFGEDEFTVLARSFIQSRLGDYDHAIAGLEGLVSSGTSRIQAYSLIAWLFGDVKHNYEKALSVLRDVTPRFSKDRLFINSLAYIHLMLGQAEDARALLEKEPPISNDLSDVAFTATWGLLYLREGNHEKARDLYRSAATLASQFGNKELADIVRQKMHLEFANEALRIGNRVMSLNEVNQGLAVAGNSKMDYSADLASLKRKLMKETAESR